MVYRERIRISWTGIFMSIWTILFGSITVIAIAVSIIDRELHLAAIIACGIMASLGLMIIGPLIIYRKKIIIKRDFMVTNQTQKRIKRVLLTLWNSPERTIRLPRGIWFSRGKIIRLSWLRRRQRIDLSRIVEVRKRFATFSIRFTPGMSWDNVRDINVDFVMLRDIDGIIHLVDLTNFRDRHYHNIIEFLNNIIVENSALNKSAKQVNIPLINSQKKKDNKEIKPNREIQIQAEIEKAKQAGLSSLLLTDAGPLPKLLISTIQRVTGKDSVEIEKMLKNLPCLIISGVSRSEAKNIVDQLSAIHPRVSIKIR